MKGKVGLERFSDRQQVASTAASERQEEKYSTEGAGDTFLRFRSFDVRSLISFMPGLVRSLVDM